MPVKHHIQRQKPNNVSGEDTNILVDGCVSTEPPVSIRLLWLTDTTLASQLFVNRLWYRTGAGLKWLFFGDSPGVSTARSPPIASLPQEIVEIILSYFIYDTPTLIACSLTCYSWYIATVSHLHHSLTTDNAPYPNWREKKYQTWPLPLKKSYELGLLPFVKRFRIRERDHEFGPKQLSGRTMHYFSAFTNLQELGIDYLQLSSFIPNIHGCFGHLSPTLRFLALQKPNGSCRQILYFIGLFTNLQDFKPQYDFTGNEWGNAADATLIPLSTPPLRGCLTLICCDKDILVKEMITVFGGLHFRHMDVFGVNFVRLLLDACTETLETLRFYPTDPCGE